MISVEKLSPKVYSDLSRDYQLLSHLFDVVLNSVKTNADLINDIPLIGGVNSNLVDLFMMTMGFKQRHVYDTAQLTAISGVFLDLIKNKGTLQAIEIAGNTVLNAEGIVGEVTCEVVNGKISINIPAELSDNNLFYDILDYILPAGMPCVVIRSVTKSGTQTTEAQVVSKPKGKVKPDYEVSRIINDTNNEITYNLTTLLDDSNIGTIAKGTILARDPKEGENK